LYDAKQATSVIEKRRVDELDGKEYPFYDTLEMQRN
jgi:hypothetical protein